jgi:hypothetical protein
MVPIFAQALTMGYSVKVTQCAAQRPPTGGIAPTSGMGAAVVY